MSDEKKELTLEQGFEQLDALLTRLEAPEISLEDSFQVYKEGVELLAKCNGIIDQVEKKVLLLNEKGELDELA